MKDTDIAYFAGILDGEGHIGIYADKLKKSHQLEVGVTNTNYWLLSQFKLSFGGNIRGPYQGYGQVMRWRVRSDEAIAFLEIVLPYIYLKKAQAEIALKFQKRKNQDRGKPLTDEELALRETERILCHNLKSLQYGNVEPD